MRWSESFLCTVASMAMVVRGDPTWPASTDEIEEIMFQVNGFRARQFGGTVIPCNSQALGPGRSGPAEWIRSAFHDMGTTRLVSGNRVGGLDGSLQFELNSGENEGQGFLSTLNFHKDYLTRKSSLADLLALGVYYAARSCGGPSVPIRAGRPDATQGLSSGFLPIPQDQPGGFENKFLRMGFNLSEGIELTSCGHTLGFVHTANFPTVIAANDPLLVNGAVGLDSTTAQFDNRNAVEYVAGNSTSPLVQGTTSNVRRTNSDTKLFSYDRNVTIKAAALDSQAEHNARCSRVFQKMIEVVPQGVTLTDPVQPYFVKPVNLQLTLSDGGSYLQFTGYIRVRNTGLSANPVTGVSITYKDRNGQTQPVIALKVQGFTSGFDDTFNWYPINSQLSSASGISSFTVTVTQQSGQTQVVDNNGVGYPMQDKILLMQPQSCFLSSQGQYGNLTVTAAIRNDRLDSAASTFVSYLQATGVAAYPIPQLTNATITLAKGQCAGYYTVFTGSYTIPGTFGYVARLDVISGSGSDSAVDEFKSVTLLGGTCSDFVYPAQSKCTTPGTQPSTSSSSSSASSSVSSTISSASSTISSTSSTISSTSSTISSTDSTISSTDSTISSSDSTISSASSTISSTDSTISISSSTISGSISTISSTSSLVSITSSTISSSTSSIPTPSHKSVMGGYKLVGCQTEADGARALADASFAYDGMTLDTCMTNCTGYNYWGTEYGRECYCANSLDPTSTTADLSDCNMLCSGDNSEYCGGGNRLELYLTTAIPTPTATLIHKPTVSPYTRVGCYTELTDARALSNAGSADDNMTNELCAQRCSKYDYFATEYSRECYCGYDLSSASTQVVDSQCNMPCAGDKYQYCGGPSRLELYHTDSVSKPSLPPNVTSSLGFWDLVGCQTDNTSARALNGKIAPGNANNTLEACAEFCDGFAYFGTEYGAECYCGNQINAGSSNATITDCNMICPGNEKQYCGGPDRLSLYEKA